MELYLFQNQVRLALQGHANQISSTQLNQGHVIDLWGAICDASFNTKDFNVKLNPVPAHLWCNVAMIHTDILQVIHIAT